MAEVAAFKAAWNQN